jgi:hypothetical protein
VFKFSSIALATISNIKEDKRVKKEKEETYLF